MSGVKALKQFVSVGAGTMTYKDNPDFLSAGALKGSKVINKAGENIGEIKRLIIDLADGRIAYAVLSFGGILVKENKLFAIPWEPLTLKINEHVFVLDISRDVLEKAESFDKDRLPLTREELTSAYTYYGYWPYWHASTTKETGFLGETEPEKMTRTRSTLDRKYPDFLPADTITGEKVVSIAGDDIGKIEELILDLKAGRVAYAVLSFSEFPVMGGMFFAIPWQALQVKLYDHAFLLNIPKEILEKAEGFDKDNLPVTSYEWLSTIYGYYGYEPYWQTPRL
jgi:PRC-barrel domain.